jgi:CRP-like cAMP-binding protein
MSFRLKEDVFKVRCREPGCPFYSDFIVKENIMGATEADVDSEALKIARNMAFIKHDALYGRKHQLQNPEVYKVSGSYDRIGPSPAEVAMAAPPAAPQTAARTFRRGEIIIRKGESALTVCEVIKGSALNEKLPDLVYRAGSTFGAAAIFRQKKRMVDIIAGDDGTTIAFYNIRELSRNNPAKARQLYDEAMEDVFHIVNYLEDYSASLEKKLKKLSTAGKAPRKPAAPAKKPAAKKKKSRVVAAKKTSPPRRGKAKR